MTPTYDVQAALDRLAASVSADPGFVAWHLARYCETHPGWSDELLAWLLETDNAGLTRLKLCRLPRPDQWAGDINRIAEGCHCSRPQLAVLLDGSRPAA